MSSDTERQHMSALDSASGESKVDASKVEEQSKGLHPPPVPPPILPPLSSSLPPPPPPVLLPPPTIQHQAIPLSTTQCIGSKKCANKGTQYDAYFSTSDQVARKAYQIFKRDGQIAQEDINSLTFISSYHPVKPVIQNGPLCGMVALSMVTELSGSPVSTEDIYTEAMKNGYSLQGEMFSAYSMQKLASTFLQKPVEVLNLQCQPGKTSHLDGTDLINALVDGHSLLIPYDADKNHGPCRAKGHKAHWALVTGFFAAFKKSFDTEVSQYDFERDEEITSLYHWKNSCASDVVKDAVKGLLKSSIDLFIFAHQGKSKYCGIWNFREMLSSNNNLLEVGPESNSTDYVIPSTCASGELEELRAKAVLIHNQCS